MTTTIKLELDVSEARCLIEACRLLEEHWLKLARTTTDENEQADYSNDSGYVASIRAHLESVTSEAFGPEVKEFPRDPLP